MVNPGEVSEPAWRLLVLARQMAVIVALAGLIGGAAGTFLATRQTQRSARWQSVLVGSMAALVVLFGLSAIYDFIAFIMRAMGGRLVDAFLPAGWPYAAPETGTALLPMAQAAAQTLSYLGLVTFALGAALWGVAPRGSRTYYRGRRGVAIGVALLAISVGGVLFATLIAILTAS